MTVPPATDLHAELFIYYRVDLARAADALVAVKAFQQQLCSAHPALQARLLRRPEATNGQQTWMESYRAEPSGISAALAAEIASQAAALASVIAGERHVETFLPCV